MSLDKLKRLSQFKIVRYSFAGGIAAVVDIAIFSVFAKILGYNYLVVAFFSFIIATLVNYIISIKVVFESGVRHTKHKEALLVYFASGVGLFLNLLILYILISILGIEEVSSKMIATGIVFFWNFGIRKYYVFAK